MKYVADRFVVLLDANVLFPFRKRDILLWFYHAGLFRARWTEDILDEWTRNLLAQKPALADSIHAQKHAMRTHFADALVTGYEPLISGLELPDQNDRHVLAAAIQCGAQHIITDNLSDFPSATLEPFDIEPISADGFLARTFDLYPSEALAVLQHVRQAYKAPPFSASAFILDLTAKGLPKLAARIRPQQEFI